MLSLTIKLWNWASIYSCSTDKISHYKVITWWRIQISQNHAGCIVFLILGAFHQGQIRIFSVFLIWTYPQHHHFSPDLTIPLGTLTPPTFWTPLQETNNSFQNWHQNFKIVWPFQQGFFKFFAGLSMALMSLMVTTIEAYGYRVQTQAFQFQNRW